MHLSERGHDGDAAEGYIQRLERLLAYLPQK